MHRLSPLSRFPYSASRFLHSTSKVISGFAAGARRPDGVRSGVVSGPFRPSSPLETSVRPSFQSSQSSSKTDFWKSVPNTKLALGAVLLLGIIGGHLHNTQVDADVEGLLEKLFPGFNAITQGNKKPYLAPDVTESERAILHDMGINPLEVYTQPHNVRILDVSSPESAHYLPENWQDLPPAYVGYGGPTAEMVIMKKRESDSNVPAYFFREMTPTASLNGLAFHHLLERIMNNSWNGDYSPPKMLLSWLSHTFCKPHPYQRGSDGLFEQDPFEYPPGNIEISNFIFYVEQAAPVALGYVKDWLLNQKERDEAAIQRGLEAKAAWDKWHNPGDGYSPFSDKSRVIVFPTKDARDHFLQHDIGVKYAGNVHATDDYSKLGYAIRCGDESFFPYNHISNLDAAATRAGVQIFHAPLTILFKDGTNTVGVLANNQFIRTTSDQFIGSPGALGRINGHSIAIPVAGVSMVVEFPETVALPDHVVFEHHPPTFMAPLMDVNYTPIRGKNGGQLVRVTTSGLVLHDHTNGFPIHHGVNGFGRIQQVVQQLGGDPDKLRLVFGTYGVRPVTKDNSTTLLSSNYYLIPVFPDSHPLYLGIKNIARALTSPVFSPVKTTAQVMMSKGNTPDIVTGMSGLGQSVSATVSGAISKD